MSLAQLNKESGFIGSTMRSLGNSTKAIGRNNKKRGLGLLESAKNQVVGGAHAIAHNAKKNPLGATAVGAGALGAGALLNSDDKD